VTTVKDDAESEGATFRTGVEVTDLVTEDGTVTGVDTETDERIRAEQVVVAAGWRTRQFVSEYVDVPTRPYRYQTYDLDHERTLTESFPMAWDERSHLYFRPQPTGELHVGGGTYFVNPPNRSRSTDSRTILPISAPRISPNHPSWSVPRSSHPGGTNPNQRSAVRDGDRFIKRY